MTNEEEGKVLKYILFQVLATMFLAISDNLPKTSYLKMVDLWLITSLLVPFFEVSYDSFDILELLQIGQF